MYYKKDWLWKNICVTDSSDMNIEPIQGDRCFIIGQHVREKQKLHQVTENLLAGGFRYFNIFGEQAELWKELILKRRGDNKNLQIESSKVDRIKMSYDLAMFSTLFPESLNIVLSDDEYFTEYLIEDLDNIFYNKSEFTVYDWQKFRSGFEFNYHGKDGIISVSNVTVLGFLGEEKYFQMSDKGFRYKLFDGKSFYEIWKES